MGPVSAEPILLIGDAEENFYTIGQKNSEAHRQLIAQLKRLLPSKATDLLTSKLGNWLSPKPVLDSQSPFDRCLKAYAEGLSVSVSEVRSLLSLLEMAGHFAQTSPHWRELLPGCLSAFAWDQSTQTPVHLRLLDFPLSVLHGPFQAPLVFQLKDLSRASFIGPLTLPLTPFTALTQAGYSLAIHHKYHSYFDPHAESIFKLVFDAVFLARDLTDVKKLLRSRHTMSSWGVYGADSSGNVMAIDIMGPQFYQQHFQLADKSPLVFTHFPLVEDGQQNESGPTAWRAIALAREKAALGRLKHGQQESLLHRLCSIQRPKNENISPILPATCQAVEINLGQLSIESITDVAPCWYQGKSTRWENVFQGPVKSKQVTKTVPLGKGQLPDFFLAQQDITLAQVELDNGQLPQSFHHLQMALARLDHTQSTSLQLLWQILQWQHLTERKELLALYPELMALTPKIPEYHRPIAKLLAMALECELDLAATITLDDISSLALRKWCTEFLNASPVHRRTLKRQIRVRLDLFDTIFPRQDATP